MSRAKMNRMPQQYKELFDTLVDGGAVATIASGEACVIVTCTGPEAVRSHQHGVTVIWTPMLALAETAAVFRFTTEFVIPGPFNERIKWDYYLNPGGNTDPEALQKFGVQDKLHHHIYSLGNNYEYTKEINIGPKTRKDIQNMLRQAQDHNLELRQADTYDYTTALAFVKDTYGYK